MLKLFTDFGHNLKDYINHIMKVSFGELIFHFFELLILILIALFTYVPLYLVQDLVLSLLRVFATNFSDTFIDIYNFVFGLIEFIIAFFAFLYMFNKRYEDIKNGPKESKDNKDKNVSKNNKPKKEEVELPKMKDE